MREVTNLAASVRAKLQNIKEKTGEDFQLLLMRFAAERLLYRLSISSHQDKFLLKGAALFNVWFNEPHRPTKDVDLLGSGENDIPTIEEIFREICQIESPDGLEFPLETLQGSLIREEEVYQGVRITLTAMLAKARIPLQIDVGFGDAVTPKPKTETLPTLLDLPAPKLKLYPKETVVAEKLNAMVKLGIGNSRMKDFWDVSYLIEKFEFDGRILQKAITATFKNRQTDFPPKLPLALTDEFATNPAIILRWNGFIKRNKISKNTDFGKIIENLRSFYEPIIEANQANDKFSKSWTNEQDWR